MVVNTLGDMEEHTCSSKMNSEYDENYFHATAHANEGKFNCSVPFHPAIAYMRTGRTIEICNNSLTGGKAFFQLRCYGGATETH